LESGHDAADGYRRGLQSRCRGPARGTRCNAGPRGYRNGGAVGHHYAPVLESCADVAAIEQRLGREWEQKRMKYRVRHSTTYVYSDPVLLCHNEVRLTPRNVAHQTR